MNIRLVPYTWARHVHVALVVMSATLVAYWLLLAFCAFVGPVWGPGADLNVLVGVLGLGTGLGSLMVEGSLDSKPSSWWVRGLLFAGLGACVATHLGAGLGARLTALLPGASEDFASAPLLGALKYSILSFATGGLFLGLWLAWWRKADKLLYGVVGLASGLAGSMVWHLVGGIWDLYFAGAFAAVAWGGAFGALAWGVPRKLYAGWIRVLSGSRFGWRVRIDGEEEGPGERVVGHYPRGMNLWLPAEEGVREMHLSVAVDDQKTYSARGLSLYPTQVKRSLEKVDIRYDATRPLPLETPLRSGDVLIAGDGQKQTVLEFVMLPRKEDS